MKTINVFIDSCIVNRILDLTLERLGHKKYEEDRLYMIKILDECVKQGKVKLFVNPSVKYEIEATSDIQRRKELLAQFKRFEFTPYNKTKFPFRLPAVFITKEEKVLLQKIEEQMPNGFKKDTKIFLDALANKLIEILLTTDYDDLAEKKLKDCIVSEGIDKKIKLFTPKELYAYLQ